LYVRGRLEGDYMHPSGRGVGKSLKKLMNEWHIFPYLRNSYPILCDESGVVLVPGYAVDERVRVTESTKHYLVCKLSEE
jgi:tRNA(Ile)-lysidine synthase